MWVSNKSFFMQSNGEKAYWEWEDASKKQMVLKSGEKLGAFIQKITSILSGTVGPDFPLRVAIDSLIFSSGLSTGLFFLFIY